MIPRVHLLYFAETPLCGPGFLYQCLCWMNAIEVLSRLRRTVSVVNWGKTAAEPRHLLVNTAT